MPTFSTPRAIAATVVVAGADGHVWIGRASANSN